MVLDSIVLKEELPRASCSNRIILPGLPIIINIWARPLQSFPEEVRNQFEKRLDGMRAAAPATAQRSLVKACYGDPALHMQAAHKNSPATVVILP